MSTLVSISIEQANPHDATSLAAHKIASLPVVVLAPHNQCNCRCVMCDIWRLREPQSLSQPDFDGLLSSFRELKVQWVAFTGGEPQLNSNLFYFARMLRAQRIRVTLLTAGLLLKDAAEAVAENIDDLIISLDGPPAVHDRIRRVLNAFDRMRDGVKAIRETRPEMIVLGRCTVQKANRNALRATIETAKNMGLQSISFLAADIDTTAFNHTQGWSAGQRESVALSSLEVNELESEIDTIIRLHQADIDSGFVAEDANKLRRIVSHFRACLGEVEPRAPRCNAPWKSAVIDASGEVRPCFFHPPFGNIHDNRLGEILNSARALRFRHALNIPVNPVCQHCVCSLYLDQEATNPSRDREP